MAATHLSNVKGWKPTIFMVLAQVIFSAMNILLKLAIHDGMDVRLIVAYRFLFGMASILPIAFFFERKKRPKLTWKVLFLAFLSGLFGGALAQNLFLKSLALTSATFVSAILNLVPAITFVVAVCLRLEHLGWKTTAGKAKVLGTLICISAAMLFTFYKGPNVTPWKTSVNLLNLTSHNPPHKTKDGNLALGIILAIISCICYSLWLIAQAKVATEYPCPLSFTALMVFFATILSIVSALCVQHDWSQWKLGWNIRLLTVAFAGIFGSGLMFSLISMAVAMRGPVFVAVFNPLTLIIVALVGSLVLEEIIHLGSLLGAILIVFGLYVVLWGKSKEIKKMNQLMPEELIRVGDQTKNKSEDKNNNQIV